MRAFGVSSLLLLLVGFTGCGPGGDFPVASTSGTVMCEGKPVPHVTVFFEPLATGESAIAGKQGIGIADENGNFVISTYGDKDGAVVGKHRIRVGSPRDDRPGFSCACVLNPEVDVMQAEVKSNEKNEFQVVLQKKTGKHQPSLDDLEALEDAKEAAREKNAATK